MLPDLYETQFRESLNARTYSRATIKTYRSMFRRMCRDFDETDLYDVVMLTQYRSQMRTGSVGIFDALWGILRFTPLGQTLPSAPRKPPVTYPHPLFADVMLLGATFGNDRLPEMTWRDVDGDFRFTESEKQSAVRCLTWMSGLDHTKPAPETPLVPKDGQFQPMQLWQIEYIINSSTMNASLKKGYAKEAVANVIEAIITRAVVLNAKASTLRRACDRAAKIGSLAGKLDYEAAIDTLEAVTDPEQLPAIAETFPLDPHDETPAMW